METTKKINITECDKGVIEEWFEDAKKQTLETLPAFMNHVLNEYDHDYGTIVHAISACALAAAWAGNHSEQGGITGFQAGFVMWDFIRHWSFSNNKCGLKIVDYDDMLYPQHKYKFEKTLDHDIFKKLQQEAKARLEQDDKGVEVNGYCMHPDVRKHMKSIVNGEVPFGYILKDDN